MPEGNRINQSDEKSEDDSEAKGEADHHENASDATGQTPKKTPPIKVRMKIENPHRTSKLRPAMLAREQDRSANKNEDNADAGAQQQQPGLAIFSQKFQHGLDAA
jgi:hypothetical protein